MSLSNRQTLINRLYKVLKTHYKPVKPPEDRLVLEHLLYACCLENAHFEVADEAFARLQQVYFDWNEVRVTTVTELGETISCLPDAGASATRLKRCLQSVFEAHYAFDLEPLKKQNLGKAVKDLEAINGATLFAIAYVTQHGLGGHAIPCSQGVFAACEELGVITAVEAAKHRVPGLERAIPKAKGTEFASLLHQLGVDFFADPAGDKVRTVVAEVAPGNKDRIAGHNEAEEVEAEVPQPESTATEPAPDAAARSRKPAVAKPPAGGPKKSKTDAAPKPPAKAAAAESKKSTTKQLSRKKPR